MVKKLFSAFMASAAIFVFPAGAQAAELAQGSDLADGAASADDAIVVTAQRREERLQDVPISITVINSQTLQQANITGLSDIAKVTPALRFDNQGPHIQPTIRGIGSAIVTTGAGSNVGIYVDGFYVANPLASDFQLLSVENVQVLKGPQGTLFGRNTTGGAILVTTSKPSTETSGIVEASYERFDAKRLEGYFTTGLSDNLALDIGGQWTKGDGYVRNIVTGSKNDARYEKWSVRAGLAFDPSDRVSLLLRYQHQDNDDPFVELSNVYTDSQLGGIQNPTGVPASSAPLFGGSAAVKPGETAVTDNVFAISNNDTFQFTVSADLDFATLTSYSQYRDERSQYMLTLTAGTPAAALIRVPIRSQTYTQELLLSSNPGTRFQWTAGAFWMSFKDRFRAYFEPGAFQIAGSNTDTRTLALFVDGTYELTDHLFVTAGARYSHDTVRDGFYETGTATGLAVTHAPFLKANRVTPRFVLRYELNPQSSVYASYTQGYKAPLYNLGGQSTARINPEKINAFEVGFKHAERNLTFDTSAFYYDYKDLQVANYVPVNGIPAGTIQNAASARIYGAEAQVHYQPSDSLEINAGGSYVHARYRHFINAPFFQKCNCFPNFFEVMPIADLRDGAMQRAPEWTGNIGVRYSRDLGAGRIALAGNLFYTSEIFFDSSEQERQGGYATLGLRLEYTDPSDRLTLAFYGDNVTDKRYIVNSQIGNMSASRLWGPPATWGVSARYSFGSQ